MEALWDIIISPIDPSRAHAVDFNTAWHGRLMTVSWGLLFPISIIITRFLKVLPGQNWPRVLDNRFWFRTHVSAQLAGGAAMAVAVWLIWTPEANLRDGQMAWLHRFCGWTIVALYVAQVFGGAVRGSRGGPDYPAPDGSLHGDHFDMTLRRVMFEYAHKVVGYFAIGLAGVTLLLGLWIANGYVWMWVALIGWWVMAAIIYAALQRRGLALDTYQAIWGPDPSLPGNCRKPIGIGIVRWQSGKMPFDNQSR